MTTRLDPAQHTALPKALLELLIARHRLGHSRWSIETDKNTTAALGKLARDGWVQLHPHPVSHCVYARIHPDVWIEYKHRIPYSPPITGGPR